MLSLPRTFRTTWLAGCGACLAAIAVWQTGMIAAVPGAIGLTALAVSDAMTRRFSIRTLRIAGALVVAGLFFDTARASAWDWLAVAAALVSTVAFALLVLVRHPRHRVR